MAEPAGEARVGIAPLSEDGTSPDSALASRDGIRPEVLKALRRRPSLVRILATLEAMGGSTWTRELIRRVGSWTHTHRRLLELAALGLVRREIGIANGKQAVWNEITPLGRQVLTLLRAEGHPALERVGLEVMTVD